MDYNDDDGDVVHISIPRELLLRLVSRHPNIPSVEPFSTDANWACEDVLPDSRLGRSFSRVKQGEARRSLVLVEASVPSDELLLSVR
jgi:hypothetical protein